MTTGKREKHVTTYDPEHFSAMGKKGGAMTKARSGTDFYRRIGKLSAQARQGKSKPAPQNDAQVEGTGE